MSEDGQLDQTIQSIRDRVDLPAEADQLRFEEPWQARAFSLVVTLYDMGVFEWNEFQSRLIKEVQDRSVAGADPDAIYYEQWIAAFEQLLVDKGICESGEIVERADEFASGHRDASEFVIGVNGHGHAHDH